jgi:hypothetical protein
MQPPGTAASASTILTVMPTAGGTTGNMFDIFCSATATSTCFSVSTAGNISFAGNMLTLGNGTLTTGSNIQLYGGAIPATSSFPNAFLEDLSPGLPPPSPPTVTTHSGTLSGPYCIFITYVNANGESLPSPSTCINFPGFTVGTSPSSYQTVSGFNVYICPGTSCLSSSAWLQNGATPVLLTNTYLVTSTPATGTSHPPTMNTSIFTGYWFMSPTIPGLPCFGTTPQPSGDCNSTGASPMALNPMTTQGDLIAGGAPNTLNIAPSVRVAAGNTGQVLIGGTLPAFTSTPTLGVTSSTTGTLTFASSGSTGTITLTPEVTVASGTPILPAASGAMGVMLCRQNTLSAPTTDTNEDTVFSCTLPNNLLTANGSIFISFGADAGASLSGTYTARVRFSGSSGTTYFTSGGGTGSSSQIRGSVWISNRNSTGSQVGSALAVGNASAVTQTAVQTSSVDTTTGTNTILITIQLTASADHTKVQLEWANVLVYP